MFGGRLGRRDGHDGSSLRFGSFQPLDSRADRFRRRDQFRDSLMNISERFFVDRAASLQLAEDGPDLTKLGDRQDVRDVDARPNEPPEPWKIVHVFP